MEAYTNFAQVYDLFMDNIPYIEWCDYITSLLQEYQISEGLLLDLGCGTGTLTEALSKKGYDMIGIDASLEMLEIAMEKHLASGSNTLYLLQDMRNFELYGTVKAIISICDSINYILTLEELIQVFSLVNNYLDPKGIFLFDLNTEYKYHTLLADNTIAEAREDSSFIWENYYDPDTKINEYHLTLFLKEKEELYHRYTETHYQRSYSLEEIQTALQKAGLTFLAAYDAFTREPVKADSERIYILARECRK
ncbi:MAG: class I SAM-dependent methyltransferase [Lachnospiraceae bacterium]|nr:class I SAM-dependent methyltransferase [Lachnospiraceae bacterium]